MNFMKTIEVGIYNGQPIRFVQEKLDGYYIEIYRGENIHLYTKGRNNDLWPKLAQIEAISRQISALPVNTHIKAELWAEGIQASSVPTLIKNCDKRLIISPFEMPLYGGQDSSGWNIEQVNQKLTGFHLPQMVNFCKGNESAKSFDDEEIDNWLKLARKRKIEGWVFKDRHCGNYYKLKPEWTIDAFVAGTTTCTSGQFLGGLKAIQIAVYKGNEKIILADVGTGFDKDFRMTVDGNTLIGRVAEIRYQNIAANGRLKFPVFIRWRDDEKSASKCIYEQLAA